MAENRFLNNTKQKRYELHVGKHIAIVEYIMDNSGTIYMIHTEVPAALEGQGVASELIRRSLEDIKDQEQKIYPICPFVIKYIRKNPEWTFLVK